MSGIILAESEQKSNEQQIAEQPRATTVPTKQNDQSPIRVVQDAPTKEDANQLLFELESNNIIKCYKQWTSEEGQQKKLVQLYRDLKLSQKRKVYGLFYAILRQLRQFSKPLQINHGIDFYQRMTNTFNAILKIEEDKIRALVAQARYKDKRASNKPSYQPERMGAKIIKSGKHLYQLFVSLISSRQAAQISCEKFIKEERKKTQQQMQGLLKKQE